MPKKLANRALEQARTALELEDGAALSTEEASVLLKHLCLAMLVEQNKDEWRARLTAQPELSAVLVRQLNKNLGALGQALQANPFPSLPQAAFIGQTLIASPAYRQRILDLATEAVLSEPLAPETCIAPHRTHNLQGTLSGRRNHLVVFAAAPLFTHEFYPLVADAFVRDSERYGRVHFNLLAAHCDWLTPNGKAQRIIYMDWEKNRFREIQLDVPLAPDSVQFLCLGAAEIDLHHRWSARFSCPQINAAAAALADQKAAVLDRWQTIGLEVPAHLICTPQQRHKLASWRRQFSAIALKPNAGTEGHNVAFFTAGAPQDAVLHHLDTCGSQGPVLAEERRDGVLFCDPQDGTQHTLAVRLNAAFDGRRHWVESAYAQIGPNADAPATRGCGGTIRELAAALPHLVRRSDGQPVSFSTQTLAAVRQQGEEAASIFPELLLVGLDLVFDIDSNGVLQPVFLEANPRPAGLGRSRYLDTSQQGVSTKLWDGLEGQFDRGAVSHAA